MQKLFLVPLVLSLAIPVHGQAWAEAAKVPGFALAVFKDPAYEIFLTEEDIEKYELDTHTIHLTEEALTRLGGLAWWQHLDKRMAGGSFLVQVDGETIYRGSFRNHGLSSTLVARGPFVPIPMLAPGLYQHQAPEENTYFSIQLPRGVEDPRSDPRILEVLRRSKLLR